MQINNKHNLNDDLFSHSVREKLDNFYLPVEDADWMIMHNRIKQEKRRQTVFRFIWGGGMIAAVGMLLFYFSSIPSGLLEDEFPLFSEEIPVGIEVEEEIVPEVLIAMDNRASQRVSRKKTAVSLFSGEEREGEEGEGEEEIIPVFPPVDNSEQEVEKKKVVTNGPMPEPSPELTDALNGRLIDYAIQKNRWKISTGLAGGGGINNGGFLGEFNQDYNMTDPGWGGDQEPPPDKEENAVFTKAGHREIQDLLNQRDYSETHHSVPISFSFAVRSRITQKVSLESGLVYTYLSSRMEQYGSQRITTRVKQHYIGIPLNVVVDVWQQAQWHWYISGGGTIEKGIRLSVNEEIMSGGRPEYIERRSGMNGVQGSLQISSGIEYALSYQWSLYVEPRFSYYFDNNQPISVRTDRPLVVSLGGGLRYSF